MLFRSALNEWDAEGEIRDPSRREKCPLREACWHHLLNVIDHPRGSVTSNKSDTNNNKKRRMRHQRLQKFKIPSTLKGLQMRVKLEGPGTLGTKRTPNATRHLEIP